MRKIIFLCFIFFVITRTYSQNYNISFAGTGAATTVDSVKVENLNQGTTLTLSGSDILHLGAVGINDINTISETIKVYPNPMQGQAEISFYAKETGNTQVFIYDINGKVVVNSVAFLTKDLHKYKVSGLKQGMYFINIIGDNYAYTTKLVSQYISQNEAKLTYLSNENPLTSHNTLKSTNAIIDMAYTTGDRLLFKGKGGIYSTIVTDVPTSNKTINFGFVACTDYENNNYTIVQIGTQTWMAENLKNTHYRNGSSIPNVTDSSVWEFQTTGAYCNYSNNSLNSDTYGRLYNWYTVNDSRNVCPLGWNVPTVAEWTSLISYLGGEMIAGGKLKETTFTHWTTPNTDATNESGFSALPGGYRMWYGFYMQKGGNAEWWSATQNASTSAWFYQISNNYSYIEVLSAEKYYGYSVRCIKDASSVTLAVITTSVASSITAVSAVIAGNVTSEGGAAVTARGICYNTSASPTTANYIISGGSGIGSFTVNLTALTPNTIYYAKAYATNSFGTAYGNQIIFNTLTIQLPTLTTTAVTAITGISAISGGDITSDGGANITFRGICYSTSLNPTLNNSVVQSGNGTGSFISSLINLLYSTTYHVRAYATNSAGTAYGNDISFVTLNPQLPTITTTTASLITYNSVTTGGNLISDGGLTITDIGVCIDIYTNPTTSDNKWPTTSGGSFFSIYAYNLSPNTTYYVRAYATNSAGTSYGNEISFTTTPTQPPTISTLEPISKTLTSALTGAKITSTGGANILTIGACYSTDTMPTVNNANITSSVGVDLFTINIVNLIPNTKYYVRAYATNANGPGYGQQIGFYTLNDSIPGSIVIDADGNAYDTVHIGTQVWMKQNLKTTKFSNGDALPNYVSNSTYSNLTTAAYSNYNNDTTIANIYGKLYNWYAVADNRGLCPTGWHVPTDSEFSELTTYLGGSSFAGAKLKETGLSHWFYPNTGSDNSSNFTALPGGVRNSTGNYFSLTYYCYFWSATESTPTYAWYYYLSYNDVAFNRADNNKKLGHAVRCMKN